jgi:hypothetical protein
MIGQEKPRPGEPRIEPLAEPSDEAAELLALAMRNGNGSSPNILTTIAHHPRLLKHFSRLGGFLLNRGSIPVREREIVILRVGSEILPVRRGSRCTAITFFIVAAIVCFIVVGSLCVGYCTVTASTAPLSMSTACSALCAHRPSTV